MPGQHGDVGADLDPAARVAGLLNDLFDQLLAVVGLPGTASLLKARS